MTPEDRRDIIECVAEGVKRALVSLKLVEETPHPISGAFIQGKTVGKFIAPDTVPLADRVTARIARKVRKSASVIALAACALAFSSCASTQPVSTFQAPSLAPVEHAVTRSEQSVLGAKSAAKKLADVTSEPCKTQEWQDAYDALSAELNSAYLSIQLAKDEITAKQVELNTMAVQANKVVAVANKALADRDKAEAERHAWVMRFWYATIALVVAAAWIFRDVWLPALVGI